MAKLREYEQRTNVAGPVGERRATAEDIGGGGGLSALGQSVSGIADVIHRRREQSDVSEIHAKFAKLDADYTVRWRETLAQDPTGDKGLMDKFLEDHQKDVEEIGTTVGSDAGRKYYTQKSAESQGHFTVMTDHTRAEQAGAFAKQRAVMAMDAGSSALIENPADYNRYRADHEKYVNELVATGALPAIKGEEMKRIGYERYSMAAMQGWIKLAPQEARKQLESGQWDSTIDAEHKMQLGHQITQAENAQRIEAERQRKEAERLKKERQEQINNGYIKDFSENKLSLKTVMDNDELTYQQKDHWMQAFKAKTHENDEAGRAEVLRRISLPPGDPQKITSSDQIVAMVGKGQIKTSSLPSMFRLLEGKGTPEYDQAQAQLKGIRDTYYGLIAKPDPVTKLPDPVAAPTWNKANIDFYDAYYTGKKAGKTDHQLLHPDSPDYVGKVFKKYQRGFVDKLKSTIDFYNNLDFSKLKSGEQRKEGESAADFLKRTGGSK